MMETMDIYIFNNNCFSKVKTIILYIIVTVLVTGNTFLIDNVAALTDVIYFADTHIGEGCNSSISGYQINDTNCYSVQDLKLAVEKINDISERDKRIAFAILGGDVTSSAQQTEFKAAKIELDKLKIDYIPLLGNHDMWSYDEVKGDLTTKPVGDLLFASTFKDIFYKWKTLHKLNYANRTVWNPIHRVNSTFQSWTFIGYKKLIDLKGVMFIAPDFSTRQKAPPPCPGHSRIGGCGVMGMAELFNFSGGSLPWFKNEIENKIDQDVSNVILLTHQPFRCRIGVPDWYFCFSKSHKVALRSIFEKAGTNHGKGLALFWGQWAGHQHRWFDGTAFDEPAFKHFRQWENSAVKGDVFDSKMASSFSIFTFEHGEIIEIKKFWREKNTWKNVSVF